jgi:hypothetical protein
MEMLILSRSAAISAACWPRLLSKFQEGKSEYGIVLLLYISCGYSGGCMRDGDGIMVMFLQVERYSLFAGLLVRLMVLHTNT